MEWGLTSSNRAARQNNTASSAPSSSTTTPMDFSSINLFSGGAYTGVGDISMPFSIFSGGFSGIDFSMMPLAPMMFPMDLGFGMPMMGMGGFSDFGFSMMPGMFDFSNMSFSMGNNNNFFKTSSANKTHRTKRTHVKRKYGAEAKPKDGLLHYKNRLSPAARAQITQIEKDLNFEPGCLEKVIYIESSGNAQAYNSNGGATGLIQFMPKTARRLGTTTAALRRMSAEEQMPYVKKYLKDAKRWAGYAPEERLSKAETYGLLLMPGLIKDDEGYWKGSAEYGGNKWLDLNKNGVINQFDLQKVVESVRIHY